MYVHIFFVVPDDYLVQESAVYQDKFLVFKRTWRSKMILILIMIEPRSSCCICFLCLHSRANAKQIKPNWHSWPYYGWRGEDSSPEYLKFHVWGFWNEELLKITLNILSVDHPAHISHKNIRPSWGSMSVQHLCYVMLLDRGGHVNTYKVHTLYQVFSMNMFSTRVLLQKSYCFSSSFFFSLFVVISVLRQLCILSGVYS